MVSKLYSRIGINGELSRAVENMTANLKLSKEEDKFFYTNKKTDKCYQIKFIKEKMNNRPCLVAEVKWNDRHNKIKYPKYLENLFLNHYFEEILPGSC